MADKLQGLWVGIGLSGRSAGGLDQISTNLVPCRCERRTMRVSIKVPCKAWNGMQPGVQCELCFCRRRLLGPDCSPVAMLVGGGWAAPSKGTTNLDRPVVITELHDLKLNENFRHRSKGMPMAGQYYVVNAMP